MIYDAAVVGGGPGGYVAAIRAAQMGGKVLIVEQRKLGGVCLNRGCIPTKTLLHSAEKWLELQRCDEYGLRAENVSFDFSRVMQRKNEVVNKLQSGIEQLVKSNDIEIVYGRATLQGDGKLSVARDGAILDVQARNIIVATGAESVRLPVQGGDLPEVIDSDGVLDLAEVPKNIVIIGAGAVGIEFAAILRAFGCEITVVEMLPSILPGIDEELVKRMGLILRRQGIKMMVNTRVTGIRQVAEGAVVTLDSGKGAQEVVAEKVLVAAGRRPVVTDLGLEKAGVHYSPKGIPVNQRMETNIPGIYAIGDVTGQFMWAHAASGEGMVAAENAMGDYTVMDYTAVPGCIFTTPEIAMVGITQQQARAQSREVRIGKFNFAANGKAVSMGATDGLVKIIAGGDDGKVLGMHILGPHASDLIMEGAIAIRNGLSAEQLASTIHPHPTLTEAVMEAAHGIYGYMIHQIKTKLR